MSASEYWKEAIGRINDRRRLCAAKARRTKNLVCVTQADWNELERLARLEYYVQICMELAKDHMSETVEEVSKLGKDKVIPQVTC